MNGHMCSKNSKKLIKAKEYDVFKFINTRWIVRVLYNLKIKQTSLEIISDKACYEEKSLRWMFLFDYLVDI